jgi:CPA1 family monovalent cation:H+ antiporter
MGHAFPHRATVVFLAYGVVVLTLVVPGMTLGPLVRRLGLERGRELRRQREEARASMAHAAIAEIERLAADDDVPQHAAERLRNVYETRLGRISTRLGGDAEQRDDARRARHLRRAVIEAQRRELDELRSRREFPAEVLHEIEHDLDVDESRVR